MKSTRLHLVHLLLVALLTFPISQAGAQAKKTAPAKQPPKAQPVPSAEYALLEEVIAIDPGRIQEIKVKPGDVVEEGDVLGSLDYRRQWYALQVAKVRANDRSKIRELQAEVSMNSSILEDHRERLRRRQVSEHTVAQSEARLSASKAKLDAAKAAQQLTELALDEAQRAYNDRFFFAPFDGVVVTVEKKKHENVGPGTVVFTVGDNSSWTLRRVVDPEVAANLFAGRTLPIFQADSDIARFARITNIIQQDNGQHVVEMSVPNSRPTTQTAPPQFEEPKFLPEDSPATTDP